MSWKSDALRRALSGCLAAGLFVVPAAGADTDVEAELQTMRDMVTQLQDVVAEQQIQIESQQSRMEEVGLDEERGSQSALSSFLTTTEFSGSIAASYFYNTNRPRPVNGRGGGAGGGGENTWTPGAAATSNPFHPDHNSIQFDELRLSASRGATEDLPVGFGFDIVYGALADINSGSGGTGGNNVWIQQAYIDYVAPWDTTLTAGKFGTHIGYETAGAADNFTITRGFTFQSFQPVSQIGVKLAHSFGPIDLMVGATNGLGENQVDLDSAKDLIWSIGWSGDMISLYTAGEYGGDAEFFGGLKNDEAIVLDGIMEITPTDATTIWLDFTWARVFEDSASSDPWGLGLSLGLHQALSDKLGLSGRFEYGHGNNEGGAVATVFMPNGGTQTDAISLTATIDYMLAEGLTIKSEVKWEQIIGIDGANDSFLPASGSGKDYQVLVGAQLVYAF